MSSREAREAALADPAMPVPVSACWLCDFSAGDFGDVCIAHWRYSTRNVARDLAEVLAHHRAGKVTDDSLERLGEVAKGLTSVPVAEAAYAWAETVGALDEGRLAADRAKAIELLDPPRDPRLRTSDAGESLDLARASLEAAMTESKAAAVEAVQMGWQSEVRAAESAGITRKTLREALGK